MLELPAFSGEDPQRDPSVDTISGAPYWLFRMLVRPAYRQVRDVRAMINDRRLGILTRDKPLMRELGAPPVAKNKLWPHQAVPYGVVRLVMKHIDPKPADCLLDLGCGAGRVICFASRFAFSRIVGVEVNGALATIAARNVSALSGCVVRPEVVCADATNFQVPDETTVVWMHNPFGGDTLRAALKRIVESYDRRPRRLRVAYFNPREHGVVTELDCFRQSGAVRFSWRPGTDWQRTQMIQFYEVQQEI